LKILGIDTSSKFLSIALSEDEDIIKEESILLDRRQSSELIPKIEELIKISKTSINKIDVFIIGLGPGSFTGLRIGVSAIKGFGIATGKPCIGVPSIDAIAFNAGETAMDIIPIIDAKRSQVYAAIYRRKAGQLARLSDYMVVSIARLFKKTKVKSVFLGDGVSLYKDNISSANKKTIFLEEQNWYPRARNLIKIGFSKIRKSRKTDFKSLTPLYLYPEDCQVRQP
jgi:tRNA threonylcarbamoyladenosine biosynthesis protein TsaB